MQFLAIANAIGGHAPGITSLWDPEDGFFKDLIVCPDGQVRASTCTRWSD